MSDYNYLNTNAHLEGLLSMRNAEITDLKVVSDHNLSTYHQAAELLRAEIADLRRAGLEWHGKFITETAATELLREQVNLYEQALLASWPEGAMGDALDFWNAARKLAATEPAP